MTPEKHNDPPELAQKSPQEQKRLDLNLLAKDFRERLFITKGIDKESEHNNQLVMEAMQNAGRRLEEHANEIFAIQLGGSRIKGYNTAKSDIDIALVTPTSTKNPTPIYEILIEELEKKGVKNSLDAAISMWATFPIQTDPEEFLYAVDHFPHELISLFGCSVYENPNLALTKLTALEIVHRYPEGTYDWEGSAIRFAETYLGDRHHTVSKIATRLKLPRYEVEQVFTPKLFADRRKKFGIENYQSLYQELRQWYKQNKRQLHPFTMRGVYEEVKEMLDAGF